MPSETLSHKTRKLKDLWAHRVYPESKERCQLARNSGELMSN